MKYFLFIFLLSNKAYSQNDNLKTQLQRVFSEAPTGFAKFKEGIKEIWDKDTIYYSNFFLEGAYDAEIVRSADNGGKWIYSCTIDSSDLERTRKSVEKWKKQLLSSLGKEFQIEKLNDPYPGKRYSIIGNNIRIVIFPTNATMKDAFTKTYISIKAIK